MTRRYIRQSHGAERERCAEPEEADNAERKMLRLAAAAAGFHFHAFRELLEDRAFGYYVSRTGRESDRFAWNPRDDNDDALRLAVKVLNWPFGGNAFTNAVSALFAIGQLPKDPHAATRLAILVAAAHTTTVT